jgi:hypothetical protein
MQTLNDKLGILKQLVESDEALRLQLAQCPDEQAFLRILADAAHAKGIDLRESELRADLALDENGSGMLDLHALEDISAGRKYQEWSLVTWFKKLFGG